MSTEKQQHPFADVDRWITKLMLAEEAERDFREVLAKIAAVECLWTNGLIQFYSNDLNLPESRHVRSVLLAREVLAKHPKETK